MSIAKYIKEKKKKKAIHIVNNTGERKTLHTISESIKFRDHKKFKKIKTFLRNVKLYNDRVSQLCVKKL